MENILKRRRMVGVLFIIMSFIMAFAQLSFANTKNYSEDAQAKKNLTTYVNGQMGSNEYEVEGGGSIKGNELFKGSPTEGFTLDSDKFSKLDKDAQQRAVNDIAQYSNEAVQSDKAKGVLGWKPRFDALDTIIATAWRWHSAHPDGYGEK